LIDRVPIAGKLARRGRRRPGAEGRNVDHFCVRVDPFDDGRSVRIRTVGIAAGPWKCGAEGVGPVVHHRPDGMRRAQGTAT
jgi:hypothetical protein